MDEQRASPVEQPLKRGVVAVVVHGERFLVIRRSELVVAPGALCFPGGGIEPGETEAPALVREFQEELGAAVGPLRCIWRSTTRWRVELAWWLGKLAESALLVPNPAEVAEVHWLTAAEMLADARLLESNREFLRAVAERQIVLDDSLDGPRKESNG